MKYEIIVFARARMNIFNYSGREMRYILSRKVTLILFKWARLNTENTLTLSG
jgi:hypothetical protein